MKLYNTYVLIFAFIFEGFKPVLSSVGSCDRHDEIF